MNLAPQNGFRRKEKAPLSRKQLTSVMDEAMPAVIQHAKLIEAIQAKIKAQDLRLEVLEAWQADTLIAKVRRWFRQSLPTGWKHGGMGQ